MDPVLSRAAADRLLTAAERHHDTRDWVLFGHIADITLHRTIDAS